MDAKKELEKLLQKEKITIEQAVQMASISPLKLLKRFNQNNLRYSDVMDILDVLGYELVITDKL